MEDEKVLLGSITEELVQTYKTYKELFNGLMSGNSGLFREYDPRLDNDNYKALSEKNLYLICLSLIFPYPFSQCLKAPPVIS